jgi:putative ABC transport system permease protein
MTLVAMVLGLMAVLLFGGYIRDINYSLQTNFVTITGHLQVQHKDYFRLGSGNPAAYGIANYERVIAAIKGDAVLAPMLTVVTPTLHFGAIAGNFASSASRTVYVSGLVVDDQNRLRAWNDYGQRDLSSRNLSLSGTPPDTAVIGTGVARVLQLCEQLGVQDCAAQPLLPRPRARHWPALPHWHTSRGHTDGAAPGWRGRESRSWPRTRAVLRTWRRSMCWQPSSRGEGTRRRHVAMHLSQAQKLVFGAGPPQVTAIALQLRHTDQLPMARQRLAELLRLDFPNEPLAIFDYETLNPFYGQTLAMFAAIFGFISVLMGAIVLFTVSNTMSMAVVERTAEIGTLRAIGIRRGGIRAMFVSEGLLLGCFGAVLGIAAALAAAWLINQLDLTWTPPGRIEAVPLAVRLAGEHRMMLGSAVGLIIVAVLSSVLPAVRAARMNIVDALRHA